MARAGTYRNEYVAAPDNKSNETCKRRSISRYVEKNGEELSRDNVEIVGSRCLEDEP